MSAKKETYELFIIDLLKQGVVDRIDIVSKFCKKFQTSDRTADTYLKSAQERYKIEREAIEKEKAREYKQSELEAEKSKILDKTKLLEMQSNLIKLLYNKMAKQKEPDSRDIQAFNGAIERYSKMQGLDAPKQVENKHEFNEVIKGLFIEQ